MRIVLRCLSICLAVVCSVFSSNLLLCETFVYLGVIGNHKNDSTKMNGSLTQIGNSKLEWKHFLMTFLLGFILTSFIYILLIPLTYWGLFGEGEIASRIENRPLNSFIIEFGALTLVLCICVILALLTYKKGKISKTKSYILTGILISIMFIFRVEIGNFIIELF